MTTQTAYDRYNARYNNAAYLAATSGMTNEDAIDLQDMALTLCENPFSQLARWIATTDADLNGEDTITAFLALFV